MAPWLNAFRQLVIAINCLRTYTLDRALQLHACFLAYAHFNPRQNKKKNFLKSVKTINNLPSPTSILAVTTPARPWCMSVYTCKDTLTLSLGLHPLPKLLYLGTVQEANDRMSSAKADILVSLQQ